ncbi:MAG: hypothetical protein AAF328_03570 [Planctomycetota bacterium]
MTRFPVALRAVLSVAILNASCLGTAASGEAAFVAIGDASMELDINPSLYLSDPLSQDGSTVVGTGLFDDKRQAFRWRQATGVVPLGHLPFEPPPGGNAESFQASSALGVSADGSVVLGFGVVGSPELLSPFPPPLPPIVNYETSGFLWTEADGLRPLADTRSASLLNTDGSVAIVSGEEQFVRWDAQAGLTPIAFEETGFFDLRALTADGASGVGVRRDPDNPPFTLVFDRPGFGDDIVNINPTEAVIWELTPTDDGTPIVPVARGLGSLPSDDPYAEAFAVSADGRVVVGTSHVGPFLDMESFRVEREAFLWSEATGMIGLNQLNGDESDQTLKISRALDVSDDGSVIVGDSTAPEGTITGFVWNEAMGMRSVYEVLVSVGQAEAIEGWSLGTVWGVSGDGTVIVGRGTDPQGESRVWIATIPEPGAAWMMLPGAATLLRRRSAVGGTNDLQHADRRPPTAG